MWIKEIVSCWVSEEIPFTGSFDSLDKSFVDAGFKSKRKDDNE